MIMCLKQRKINFKPRIKLNHNISIKTGRLCKVATQLRFELTKRNDDAGT